MNQECQLLYFCLRETSQSLSWRLRGIQVNIYQWCSYLFIVNMYFSNDPIFYDQWVYSPCPQSIDRAEWLDIITYSYRTCTGYTNHRDIIGAHNYNGKTPFCWKWSKIFAFYALFRMRSIKTHSGILKKKDSYTDIRTSFSIRPTENHVLFTMKFHKKQLFQYGKVYAVVFRGISLLLRNWQRKTHSGLWNTNV